MKIGILSINLHTHSLNYGAVLHSWASQQLMLRREDVEYCEIIDYVPPIVEGRNLKYPVLNDWPQILLYPLALIKRAVKTFSHCKKYDAFEKFFQENLTISNQSYTQAGLAAAHLPYDTLLIESDVIWSPRYFNGQLDPAFFGAMPSMKDIWRVVYAASMADPVFTEEQEDQFRELLKGPDAISIRETYNSEFARRYTDKPIYDVLDPVMLLDKEDYEKLMCPPARLPKRPFVVVYFPMGANRKVVRWANAYARKRGWDVIEISNQYWRFRYSKVKATAGINEFLWYMNNAQTIFSSSLHGTILSFVFHKDFYCFERSNGRKYIDLCEKFGLEDRFVKRGEQFDETKAQPIDWEKIDRRKRELREESLNWLDAALKRRPLE